MFFFLSVALVTCFAIGMITSAGTVVLSPTSIAPRSSLLRAQVLFSWQTTVGTTSLRLSQPSMTLPSGRCETGVDSGHKPVPSDPKSSPKEPPDHSQKNEQLQANEKSVCRKSPDLDVLNVQISNTNVGMGFRGSGNGISLEGSIHAISASALGGSKILSISPTTLWGTSEDEFCEGLAGRHGLEGEVGTGGCCKGGVVDTIFQGLYSVGKYPEVRDFWLAYFTIPTYVPNIPEG